MTDTTETEPTAEQIAAQASIDAAAEAERKQFEQFRASYSDQRIVVLRSQLDTALARVAELEEELSALKDD